MIVEVARPAAAAGLIVTDAPNLESWSHFVSDHPRGSIFHTPEMVQVFGKTLRNYPLALAAIDEDGGMLALLVAVRVQTLPGPLGAVSSRSILYAEPICRDDERGRSALAAVIAEHDARMRGKVLFTEVRALRAAGPEQEALLQCGYRREDYLNYVTDLTKPAQDLLDAMTKQMRRSIRTSQERGLRVEDATSTEGVEVLLGFLTGAYANAGVPLADRSLFEQTIRVLRPRGMVKLITAYHNDRPVGAALGLIYKDTVFAWYRGSERMDHLAPSECMIWHDLEWGHSEGYKIYDSGGAGKPDVPYGVRDFKAKFGGQLVNYGRYYKVYSPWKLRLAEAAYNWKRNAGHRRSLGPASNTVQSSASRDPNAQTPPQETMR